MQAIFDVIFANKPIIINAYKTIPLQQIQRFLFQLTYEEILKFVESYTQNKNRLPQDKIVFIANFYKYSFVGIVLEWIDKGMHEDYQKIVDDVI